jgi:elongator complex protein 1
VEYIFTIARGPTAPPKDLGLVAVIDGQVIKVTPFAAANIPPPMALQEITVPSNALDVAINSNASIAVLHRDGISVFEYENPSTAGPPLALKRHFAAQEMGHPSTFYQSIAFAPNNEVLILHRYPDRSAITRYSIKDDSGKVEEELSPALTIRTLASFTDGSLVKPFSQDMSGVLCSLLHGDQSTNYGTLTPNLPWVEIVPNGKSHIAFGLSAGGLLYANSRLLVKNCTSFLVTPAHLIFTTTSHLIKFIHITDIDGMSSPYNLDYCYTDNVKI